MTPFRQHREAIGWGIQHLADMLNVNERTVRRWDKGEFDAPPAVVAWLARLAGYHESNPPPARLGQYY